MVSEYKPCLNGTLSIQDCFKMISSLEVDRKVTFSIDRIQDLRRGVSNLTDLMSFLDKKYYHEINEDKLTYSVRRVG